MNSAFQQAVEALFSGDPSRTQQANSWLNSFSRTPEAWEASLALLEPSVPGTVLFFAANMLLNKTRTDWGRLPMENRVQLTNAVSNKLQLLLQANIDVHLVVQRLCLVLAAMASRTSPQAVQAYIAQALSMASQAQSRIQLECALLMLSEVRQESSDLDMTRSTANLRAMESSVTSVVALVQQVLVSAASTDGMALAAPAVKCLHSWCDTGGMGEPCITATRIHTEAPTLFSALFSLLGMESESLGEEAASVLVTLLSQAPGDFTGPAGLAWRACLVAAVSLLAAHRPVISAPGDHGAQVARAVARCGTAISDACAEFVTGGLHPPAPGPEAAGPGAGPQGPGTSAAAEAEAALQLADIMLACLSRPEQAVADAALDYFINLNTVPVVQRAPQFRGPVWASAVPMLMQQARYSPDFTTWEEDEQDEDVFYRYRDFQLLELLECCFHMTGATYLGTVQAAAAASATWQQYEAALYCLRAVNMPVKVTILDKDRPGSEAAVEGRSPEALAKALTASNMLHAVLADMCTQGAGGPASKFLSNPWVLKEAVRLIGEYAAWFGKAGALAAIATAQGQAQAGVGMPPLEAALGLLLRALEVPQAQRGAAQAFRNLCVRCAGQLAEGGVLRGLMDVAMRAVAPAPDLTSPASSSAAGAAGVASAAAGAAAAGAGAAGPRGAAGGRIGGRQGGLLGPESEWRTAVVEGLSRVVAGLPHESMADAGLALTAPLVRRAQVYAQAGTSVRPEALGQLAEDLALLGAALRFMEFPGNPPPGQPHPALKVLEAAWPVLAGVAEHPTCQREPRCVEALCEVYQRALMSARGAARGLLPTLIASVGAIFAAAPQPACCDVLGTAIELFGDVRSAPEVGSLQAQALAGAVAGAGEAMKASLADVSPHAELMRALFSMADRYFVFARDTLLDSPALPQLVGWGVVAVGMREREPVAAALAFLTHVIGVADKLAAAGTAGTGAAEDAAAASAQRARLEVCMAAEGERLVHSLLRAAGDSCPRQLARPLAGAVWALTQSSVFGNVAAGWLAAGMQSREFIEAARGALTLEEAARFSTVLLRRPPLPRGRFDALLADLSAVLRGEAGADVVMAYEM